MTQPFLYAGKLALFTAASLGVAGAAGLLVKNQAKLTMYCQIVFLPSILLSGIMFLEADLLPGALECSEGCSRLPGGTGFLPERKQAGQRRWC